MLPGHTPLLALLGPASSGTGRARRSTTWSIAFGFAEVQPDRVTILAQIAERAEEIDVARAEAAKKRAEERLARPTADIDFERARIALLKSLIRLQVAHVALESVVPAEDCSCRPYCPRAHDLARRMFAISPTVRYRGLIQSLVARELKARYRGSVLGFFWSFINPLLLLLVYSFVFTTSCRTDVEGLQPYALFMFCGILPWTWFSSSLTEASGSLIAGGNLIKKVLFPAEVLPIVSVLANMVHFFLGLPILLAFLIGYRHWPDPARPGLVSGRGRRCS